MDVVLAVVALLVVLLAVRIVRARRRRDAGPARGGRMSDGRAGRAAAAGEPRPAPAHDDVPGRSRTLGGGSGG